MNQEDLKTRINELAEKRTQCQNLFQRVQSDILILSGAIDENTNHLNNLIQAEEAAKINAEKEATKKTKKRKAKALGQPENNEDDTTPDTSIDEPESETSIDVEQETQEDLAA